VDEEKNDEKPEINVDHLCAESEIAGQEEFKSIVEPEEEENTV
jgi:hypothetical protein